MKANAPINVFKKGAVCPFGMIAPKATSAYLPKISRMALPKSAEVTSSLR